MISDGHVSEEVEYATSTLSSMPDELQSDGLIHHVAQAALTAVPAQARSLPDLADYRHLLVSTASGRRA
jgi:hypothetical protein